MRAGAPGFRRTRRTTRPMNLETNTRYRVVVVGGGISGLAAAHRVLDRAPQRGHTIDLELFEASQRLGGVIQTVKEQGFLLEGGPDSFISEKPWGVNLCRRLGLGANLIGTAPTHRRSFIVRHGKLLPVPEGFYLMAPNQFRSFLGSPLLSWPGKLRMATDLLLPRRRHLPPEDDESLADFVRRRLGQEVLERLAQPLVGGIYTSDPEKLGLRATFPRFLEMEEQHRSVLLALWRSRKTKDLSPDDPPAGPRYGLFVSLDEGMQRLVDRLQEKIPAPSLHLGSKVISLRYETCSHQWLIELEQRRPLKADGVCLALPAHQSAALLEALDPGLAEKLRRVEYASTATVNLAYSARDIPGALDGFGFLAPAVEKRPVLACSYSHRKFAGRAPEKGALLRAFLGGALQPETLDCDDEEMIALVRRTLGDLLGITHPPLLSRVDRHPGAMPQYGVGHLDLVAQIESHLLKWPNLQLAGNGFTGIGIPDCIRRAEQCVDQLLVRLTP